jgi:CheY-like chemotaxis protein
MAQIFRRVCSVVYVDDNFENQIQFQDATLRTGTSFQIRPLFSAESALAYLTYLTLQQPEQQHSLPAFLLCDFAFQAGRGCELVAAIRFIPSYADLIIIMLSDFHHGRSIAQSYSVGVNHFLRKPLTETRLDILVKALYSCATLYPPRFESLVRLPEYLKSPEPVPAFSLT